MITLSDKKVQHLQDLVDLYYELDNEMKKADTASCIIGILDYVFHTDSVYTVTANDGMSAVTYCNFVKENDQEAGSSTC